MGLNETYSAVRSNILMIAPLPSVNHAYSLLMQDEKQKEVYVNPQFPGDSSYFLVGSQNSGNQKPGACSLREIRATYFDIITGNLDTQLIDAIG